MLVSLTLRSPSFFFSGLGLSSNSIPCSVSRLEDTVVVWSFLCRQRFDSWRVHITKRTRHKAVAQSALMRFEPIIKKRAFLWDITGLRGRNYIIPCFMRNIGARSFFANFASGFWNIFDALSAEVRTFQVCYRAYKSGTNVIICWDDSSCAWKPDDKITAKNSNSQLSFSSLTDDLCCCDLDRDRDNSSANRGDWSTQYSKVGNRWQRSSWLEVFDAISTKNVAREDKFPARWVSGMPENHII